MRGTANVRLGMNSSTPSILLETTSSDQWGIDNASGVLRFVRNNSTTPVQFSSGGNVTATGNAIFQGSGTTIFNQSGGDFGIGTASPSGFQVNRAVLTTARTTANVRLGLNGSAATLILESGSSDEWSIDNASGTFRWVRNNSSVPLQINSSGQLGLGGVASYILHATSTNAFGLPRGTVAQRPTIAASTTPFRYNTDSTALEYGESVGTWRQLATRAYARTMKDGNGIYGGSGSLVGSTTITSGNANVDWDNVSGFTLISGGATGATSITSDVYNSTKQYVNLAKSKYVQRYQTFDSRALTVSANPNFVDVFEWNTTGSTQYEWGNATILDTTNSIFTYKQGGRYFAAFHQFVGNRPTSGTVARLVPLFDFNQ